MLAIIDWGIGGISIYRRVKEKFGRVPVIYFSDTGVTPYGKMSKGELVGRLNSVIRFLEARSVSHLIIGCNAASTAIDYLDDAGLKIEGVIGPAIEATARLKPKRLGVIGGRRTIHSQVYRKAFDRRGISVRQRIAQPLSGLIESGDTASDELKNEARRILAPLRNSSHILLACTHYPAITPLLSEFVSPDTRFIDPAGALVSKIEKWRLNGNGEDEFLTSGDPAQMRRSAKLAFDVDLGRSRKIQI